MASRRMMGFCAEIGGRIHQNASMHAYSQHPRQCSHRLQHRVRRWLPLILVRRVVASFPLLVRPRHKRAAAQTATLHTTHLRAGRQSCRIATGQGGSVAAALANFCIPAPQGCPAFFARLASRSGSWWVRLACDAAFAKEPRYALAGSPACAIPAPGAMLRCCAWCAMASCC